MHPNCTPLPAILTGSHYAINDLGQVVGATGTCGPFNAIEQNNLTPLHAVLWQNGKATDLGNLGGDGKSFRDFCYRPERLRAGCGNIGHDRRRKLSWLSLASGTHHRSRNPDGRLLQLGLAISNNGLVVGASISASFSPRAALWRNGIAIDMNTLVPQTPPCNLESACSVNDKGEIIGFAALKSNPSEYHAYLAKPVVNSDDEK